MVLPRTVQCTTYRALHPGHTSLITTRLLNFISFKITILKYPEEQLHERSAMSQRTKTERILIPGLASWAYKLYSNTESHPYLEGLHTWFNALPYHLKILKNFLTKGTTLGPPNYRAGPA